MKTANYFFATVLAVFAFAQCTSVVSADDVEQSQSQEYEVVCDVGAYGQNVNCRASGSQEQYQRTHFERGQRIAFRDGKAIRAHKVVDTGLDTTSFVAAFSVILLGGAASALKIFA